MRAIRSAGIFPRTASWWSCSSLGCPMATPRSRRSHFRRRTRWRRCSWCASTRRHRTSIRNAWASSAVRRAVIWPAVKRSSATSRRDRSRTLWRCFIPSSCWTGLLCTGVRASGSSGTRLRRSAWRSIRSSAGGARDCRRFSSCTRKTTAALQAKQVPVELLVATGGHGFGLGRGPDSPKWKDAFLTWLDKLP